MPGPGGRSPIAIGFEWASRISLAGVAFCLPILGGFGLDRRFGSAPLGVLIGLVLGGVIGLLQVIRLARDSSRPLR